ncbi:MAG: beta-lactamase family protein [Nocardioidaceae bacterium]|nr:beta-lactamase family protein [Nocardioidaceae bacterium]
MPDVDVLIDHLATLVPRLAAEHGVPGIAVGLCDRTGPLWSQGFGGTGAGSPVGTRTMFSVQSTSKLVTATGVLLAVQEGLAELDEPVVTYLPDLTVRSDLEEHPERRITLRHLLTHTAGLTHEAPVGSNYEVGEASFEEHLASIAETYLRFPVGHHHEYSNLGIDLAGHAVAAASGLPFAEFMRTRLFAPLALDRSTFDFARYDAEPDRAIGHSRAFADAGVAVPRRVPMVPSGGLYTCVDDLLGYLSFQLDQGRSVLRPELVAQHLDFPRLRAEQVRGYGLGVYVDTWEPGVRVLHHGGAGFGFLCQALWLPDLGIGAAVLTNAVDHDVQNELAAEIVRLLAGAGAVRSAPVPGSRQPAGSSVPEDAAGTYVGRLGDVLRVEPESPPPDADFLRDSDGHVRYLLDRPSGEVRYRTAVPGLPPARLPEEALGTYAAIVNGVPLGWYRLRHDAESDVIDLPRRGSLEDPITLQLVEVAPGRYRSATGETLLLDGLRTTYANIPLTRREAS